MTQNNIQPKEKTKVGKFLSGKLVQNVLAPIVRSAVKSVPIIGTPLAEIASNLTGAKKIDKATGSVEPKHSYVSIIMQCGIAIAVLFAFYTKTITVTEVVTILKQFIPAP